MPIHYGSYHWPEPKSPRAKQLAERWGKVANLIERTPRVRVVPRDDNIRKGIVHPDGNLKFPEKSGSVEWPLDGFTQRRLYDGTVSLEAGQKLDPKIEQLVPHHASYVESERRVIMPGGVTARPDERHREHAARQAELAEAEQQRRTRATRTETPKT